MRKASKNLISLVVVLIFGLSLYPTSYADPVSIAVGGMGGLSGAGLFGSLSSAAGVDIGWSNSDNLDAMWNTLNPDHVYFSSEANTETKTDPQTQVPTVYDYITLDATGLHDAMLDNIKAFVDDNNVTDNSSGNVTQPKHYKGYSLYNYLNGYSYGASVGSVGVGTYGVADITLTITDPNPTGINYSYACSYPGGSHTGTIMKQYQGKQIYFGQYYNDYPRFLYMDTNGLYALSKGIVVTISSGVNIPWTSGTVNTNVFDGYTRGAKISIPRSISGLIDGFTPEDFLISINDVWSRGLKSQIQIEENELPPVPPTPPVPIPTTPISDVPFDEFVDLWGNTITSNQVNTNEKLDFIGSNGNDQLEELQDINHQLDYTNSYLEDIAGDTAHISAGTDYILQDLNNIDTNVGDIEGYTENIDTNIDSLVDTVDNIDTNITSIESLTGSIDTNVDNIADTAESIDTNLGIGNGLLGDIKSLAQSAVDFLDDIAEKVDELVESVVQATETLIAGILNQIPALFGVIFDPIKRASSIWHYVVEWIQSITAPMSWIWSMASGTSYYIILPVYASLAGSVVLAFYKRFGR